MRITTVGEQGGRKRGRGKAPVREDDWMWRSEHLMQYPDIIIILAFFLIWVCDGFIQ